MNTPSPSETKQPTFVVRLIRTERGRRGFPTKVGVTFPTDKGNHRIQWEVIPADCELRDSVLVLVPYDQRETVL